MRSGAITIVVDNLENLFGFDDPDSVPIDGLPSGVAVGDFDNLNGVDLAITIPNGLSAGSVLVLLNAGTDGGGNWLGFGSSSQTTVGVDPSGVTVGFLDSGTDLDIAVTNRGDNTVSVLLNDGAGGFPKDLSPVSVGSQPSAIGAADYDGDTTTDLVVTNAGDDTIQFLFNDGGAGFPTSTLRNTGSNPFALDPCDLDNDKDTDAVTANANSNDISVIMNLGGGNFAPAVNFDVGLIPVDLAAGDFDGDGLGDLVTANNGDGTVSVLLNNSTIDTADFLGAVNLPVGDLPRSLTAVGESPRYVEEHATILEDPPSVKFVPGGLRQHKDFWV